MLSTNDVAPPATHPKWRAEGPMNADSTKSSASAQGNSLASIAAHCNGTLPWSFKLAHRNDEYLHVTRVQLAHVSCRKCSQAWR